MATCNINTRFLIISDTHDLDPASIRERSFQASLPFPKVDVLLHCGDLTEYGGIENYKNAIRLMASIDAEKRLFIAGNHDVSLDPKFHEMQKDKADILPPPTETYDEAMEVCAGDFAKDLGVTYLTEGTHRFELSNGALFTIYASPYSTKHGDWAFQHSTIEDRYNHRSSRTDSTVVTTTTASSVVPSFSGVDVVMTHGPPRYMFDTFGHGGNSGCEFLLKAISRARPLMHCFGHVHSGWGARAVLWRRPETGGKRKRANDEGFDSRKKPKVGERTVSASQESEEEWDKDEQAPLFVGKNQTRKKGYALLDTTRYGYERGEATWIVNAAIQDNEGQPSQAPWLVELPLPRRTGTE